MQGIIVVVITISILLYGSKWINIIDEFLAENNKPENVEVVAFQNTLLLSVLSFLTSQQLSSFQFEICEGDNCSLVDWLLSGKIDVYIGITPITHSLLTVRKYKIPIEGMNLYNDIYVTYLNGQNPNLINLFEERYHG